MNGRRRSNAFALPDVRPCARTSRVAYHPQRQPDPARAPGGHHPSRSARSQPGGAVAVITEAAIRELAAIKGGRGPINSCYLDVDGRRVARHQDLEREVDILLHSARAQADGEASVQSDLNKISQLVRSGLDRSRTPGLAIFACTADRLWQVIELPVPVRARVVINHVPAVGQLESVL